MTVQEARQTIGLVALVRDETETIERTLQAVSPIIDHWTIIDTGSADDTKGRAARALNGIPGTMWSRDWIGFAHNRTEALELARGTADYHLFLDADLLCELDLPLPELTADAYNLRFAGDFRMSLPLLLRDGPAWKWTGAAHAYLDVPDGASVADLPNIVLHETRTLSPRADKIQRDAELLEREISPRTIFYLAQSYRDLGHTRPAADLYRLRARLSAANPEEVFWSLYQEGVLRFELDGLAAATPILLEAWQRRPSRAEPLWKLAREHRLAGQPEVALLFAERAARIPMPDDPGFVLAWIYEWGARMEVALCHQWLGNTFAALSYYRALEHLALDDEPAGFVRDQIAILSTREAVAA